MHIWPKCQARKMARKDSFLCLEKSARRAGANAVPVTSPSKMGLRPATAEWGYGGATRRDSQILCFGANSFRSKRSQTREFSSVFPTLKMIRGLPCGKDTKSKSAIRMREKVEQGRFILFMGRRKFR